MLNLGQLSVYMRGRGEGVRMTYQSAPLQALGSGTSKEVNLTYPVCGYV